MTWIACFLASATLAMTRVFAPPTPVEASAHPRQAGEPDADQDRALMPITGARAILCSFRNAIDVDAAAFDSYPDPYDVQNRMVRAWLTLR